MSSTEPSESMQSWWESIAKARTRIVSLSSLLPTSPSSSFSLSALADSDRPALSFLSSLEAYDLFSSAISVPSSGTGSDPLCQWLYETYLSCDPNLRLVVLSFVPLLIGLYLGRLHTSDSASTPSLAGFEAVLLAIYTSEAKSRAGKPVVVNIPDLSQPSLYHTPRNVAKSQRDNNGSSVGLLCPSLEPQTAVKSTKRPIIIGVALDCYFKQISQMPSWSKKELCWFAAGWAGEDCDCKDRLDVSSSSENTDRVHRNFSEDNDCSATGEIESVEDELATKLNVEDKNEDLKSLAVRLPLPWEMLQPLLRIIGHCLLAPLNSQDVKDAGSLTVRRFYARASHDLMPQAILATRSLVRLDNRARDAVKESASLTNFSSSTNTPTKVKKPEILLASK